MTFIPTDLPEPVAPAPASVASASNQPSKPMPNIVSGSGIFQKSYA